MIKCSTPLIIRKAQIKTKGYHSTLVGEYDKQSEEQEEHLSIVGGSVF